MNDDDLNWAAIDLETEEVEGRGMGPSGITRTANWIANNATYFGILLWNEAYKEHAAALARAEAAEAEIERLRAENETLRAALEQAGRDLISIADCGPDPLEPVADNGGCVWDLVRHDARWMGGRARTAARKDPAP